MRREKRIFLNTNVNRFKRGAACPWGQSRIQSSWNIHKELIMKLAKYLALLASISLLMPLSVLAKTKNEGNLQLTQAVQVGATQLAPGNYKVEWTGPGPVVQVSILQHNKTVVTTSGKIVNQKNRAPYDDVVLKPVNNNSQKMKIEEIDFGNRTQALRLLAG
jgi:hypothetical protein